MISEKRCSTHIRKFNVLKTSYIGVFKSVYINILMEKIYVEIDTRIMRLHGDS